MSEGRKVYNVSCRECGSPFTTYKMRQFLCSKGCVTARRKRRQHEIRAGQGRGENPVVYYITRPDRPGQVKIGYSTNVLKRCVVLAKAREGHRVTLLAVEPGGQDVERARHAMFHAMRLDGEWFSFGAPIIAHVMSLDQVPVVIIGDGPHQMPVEIDLDYVP